MIGTIFVEQTGFLEWAAGNDLIVLFPQAAPFEGNDRGCWDFWGGTGVDYYNNKGVQPNAIKKMIERIIS